MVENWHLAGLKSDQTNEINMVEKHHRIAAVPLKNRFG